MIIIRSFVSSRITTILSKSFVKDLKIFYATWLSVISSPFIMSLLATFCTWVMNSITPSFSSIVKHSNSLMRACTQTFLTWISPLYATFRIFEASFANVAFTIFSKLVMLTTLNKKYNVDPCLIRVLSNVVACVVVRCSSSLNPSNSSFTIF